MSLIGLPSRAPRALDQRMVLVSGAHGGLGSAAAVACAQAGATVVLLGRKVPKLNRVYDAVAQVGAEQVLALAGGQPMLELVQAVEHSAVAADAPAELRLAAEQITLTDAAGGAAVEVLYRMVRAAEKSV